MAVGDTHVFPGFLTPVLTQLFFPKPPTTFPTCFCRGERRKYAGKKSRLNRGLNSQSPGHESDKLTTEPPGRGFTAKNIYVKYERSITSKAMANVRFFADKQTERRMDRRPYGQTDSQKLYAPIYRCGGHKSNLKSLNSRPKVLEYGWCIILMNRL